jgi:hypothetical protein
MEELNFCLCSTIYYCGLLAGLALMSLRLGFPSLCGGYNPHSWGSFQGYMTVSMLALGLFVLRSIGHLSLLCSGVAGDLNLDEFSQWETGEKVFFPSLSVPQTSS